MAQIDDFKANLIGGGARANQFRITITPPPGIAIGLDVRRTSFLVTAAAIPAIEMAFIAVPFRGRNIQYVGDRADPADWTVTFYNDTQINYRLFQSLGIPEKTTQRNNARFQYHRIWQLYKNPMFILFTVFYFRC